MTNSANALINLSGPDADRFLQGQLTIDINILPLNQAKLAACCNQKGRIIASFWIIKTTEADYQLCLPKSNVSNMLNHFKKYAVFSKVSIQEISAISDVFPSNLQDPQYLFDQGIVLVEDSQSDSYLPQMLNYDQLDAISFTKGCYLGQEIVARTQHLGQLKQRLFRCTAKTTLKQAPKKNDTLTVDQIEIGCIVQVDPSDPYNVLAVLRISALSTLENEWQIKK